MGSKLCKVPSVHGDLGLCRYLPTIFQITSSVSNNIFISVNVGEDCPVFDGLYEFCQLSAGGSVAAAVKLNKQVQFTI